MQEKQQNMEKYIKSLEDTVIALSESEDESIEHRTVTKMAKKIKRKRKEINNQMNEDSNTSYEGDKDRRPPKFKQNKNQHRPRFFTIQPMQNNDTQEKQKDMEVEEEKHHE